MSTINSWCGRICTLSFTTIITIHLLDYKSNTLPLNGLWLVLYTLIIIISTVWLSCFIIQKLLQQNQVFEYDFDKNAQLRNLRNVCRMIQVPFLKTEPKKVTKVKKIVPEVKSLKCIDERIELFANDIEQRFISKWYQYVSDEKSFPKESKTLLENVSRRVLQVSVQVDSGKIACGILVILLKHLKEYRKATKRALKTDSNIEDVYRYSHVANKSDSALEHYTHRLTANVLREFISWELWNSLPSRLLVAILSKRLTTYAIHYFSQPGFVNYKFVSLFATKKAETELQLENYSYISISDINLSRRSKSKVVEVNKPDEGTTPRISPKKEVKMSLAVDSVIKEADSMIEKALTKMLAQHTAPILQRAEKKDENSETDAQIVSIF